MNVKEEVVDDDIVVKDEQSYDSVTVPLSCMVQQPRITQRCLKEEHSDSDNECPCEECTGSAWIQGEGGHWIKVKVEKESAPGDHPTEVQPVVSTPAVCLNLPADTLGSFFGDKEEEVGNNEQTTGSNTSKPLHQCSTCGKTFKYKSKCIAHEWTHDPARPKPYACANCGKAFPTRWQLRLHETIHQRVHDSERNQARCIDCGSAFSKIEDLLIHRQNNCHRRKEQTPSDWTHSQLEIQVNPVVEGTTETLATQVTPLESTRTIPNPSSGRCSTCGKTFRAGWQLEKHELIHSDVRELFVCYPCGKSYTREFTLRKHQLSRCVKNHYRCSICRRFSSVPGDCSKHFLSEQSEQGKLRCIECKGHFDWSSLQIQHRQHCSKYL